MEHQYNYGLLLPRWRNRVQRHISDNVVLSWGVWRRGLALWTQLVCLQHIKSFHGTTIWICLRPNAQNEADCVVCQSLWNRRYKLAASINEYWASYIDTYWVCIYTVSRWFMYIFALKVCGSGHSRSLINPPWFYICLIHDLSPCAHEKNTAWVQDWCFDVHVSLWYSWGYSLVVSPGVYILPQEWNLCLLLEFVTQFFEQLAYTFLWS